MKKLFLSLFFIFNFFTENKGFSRNSNVRSVVRQEKSEAKVLFRFTNSFIGLIRSDNACYANVSLQLLINSPRFYELLLNKKRLVDEGNYLLSLLKPFYSDYVNGNCNKQLRIDLIRYIMSFNGQDSVLNFGNFSSPNIFMDFFFKKLVPGSENFSLNENLKLFGINVLSDQDDADAVILHVNGNHYVIKFRVDQDLWVLIDEDIVYYNLNNGQIDKMYNEMVLPVFFVKYNQLDEYLPLYEPIDSIITDIRTLNILYLNNIFIIWDLAVLLKEPNADIGPVGRELILEALMPYVYLFTKID